MKQLYIRSASNAGWIVRTAGPESYMREYGDEYVFTDIHAMSAWIKEWYEQQGENTRPGKA